MKKPKKISWQDAAALALFGVRASELPARRHRKRNLTRRHRRRPLLHANVLRHARMTRNAIVRSSFLYARQKGDWQPPPMSPIANDGAQAIYEGTTKREIRLRRQAEQKKIRDERIAAAAVTALKAAW